MTWKAIPDARVRHIWADPDGKNEIALDPTFYAQNGTPVCDDGPYEGDDRIFVRTEIDEVPSVAEETVKAIINILYFDVVEDALDPDREWDSDVLEDIADVVNLNYDIEDGAQEATPRP